MAVGCGQSCSYSRLKSLDQESIPLVTLIKSIAMGNFPKYTVAKASEYLIITGAGIDNIKIAKKAWILPGQSSIIFDIAPVDYTFKVQAMSADKLSFILPAVFTIGPQFSDEPSLYRCAKLITTCQKDLSHVHEIVKRVIERETRVLAASMTMEEIFRGTEFKKEVFDKVKLELKYFGLLIYNAEVKQPVDVPGHNCCAYLGLKKLLPPLFNVLYEQTGLLPPGWICKNIES